MRGASNERLIPFPETAKRMSGLTKRVTTQSSQRAQRMNVLEADWLEVYD